MPIWVCCFVQYFREKLSLSAAWAAASAMLHTMHSGRVRSSAPSDTAAIGFLPQMSWDRAVHNRSTVLVHFPWPVRPLSQRGTVASSLAVLCEGQDGNG